MGNMGFTSALWKYGYASASDDILESAIAAAKEAQSLHSSCKAAQALLVAQKPEIDGTVLDESRTGDGTAFLGGRATSFDGVDQKAYSTYSSNGNFRPFATINQLTTVRFIFKCDTAAGNQQFFSFYTNNAGLRLRSISTTTSRLQWIDGLTPVSVNITDHTGLMDGNWHEVVWVYDGSTAIIYIDGREHSQTAIVSSLSASVAEDMAFGSSEALNSDFAECEILTFQLWRSKAFTAAETRDLYLNELDLESTDYQPDVSLLFDGPNVWDQCDTLDKLTVDGTTDPTLFESGEIPPISTDMNSLGYTVNGSSQNVPKRLGTELDAEGNALQYSGPLRRNGQLENGPCLELDSANNQYIEIPNSDTFDSDTDWTLTGEINFTTVVDQRILTQAGGSSYMYIVCRNTGTPEWNSWFDGSWIAWNLITAPAAGKDYKITLTKSGTSLTFTVENLTDGTTETQAKTETFDSRSGNFFLGSNRAGTANHVDAKLWNWKLDHANGFELPLAEGNGTVAFDVSGNGKHGEMSGSTDPTWSTQQRYFYNQAEGFSDTIVWEDGIELTGATVDFDGVKSATLELDFVSLDTSTSQTIFTNGSVAPFYIRVVSGELSIGVRNGSNAIITHTPGVSIDEFTLYRIQIVFTEDEDNPTTESSIVVYDRITGAELGSSTGIDLGISSASANNGQMQVGNYTNAASTFQGIIYRVNMSIDSTNVLDTTFPSFVNNADGYGDFSEAGGTLGHRYVPAGSSGDVFGYTVNAPAGKFYDAGVSINLAPVANTQWINYRWQNAEGNGTTSSLLFDSQVDLTGEFSVDFRGKTTDSTGIWISKNAGGQVSKLLEQSSHIFVRTVTDSDTTVDDIHDGVEHYVEWDRSSSDVVTLSIDATPNELYSGAAQAGTVELQEMFCANGSGFLNAEIRSLLIVDEGATVLDMPLLGNSLDLSANVNHGGDADVTYNKLSVTTWSFGDTALLPMSVIAENSTESKFISFTAGIPA